MTDDSVERKERQGSHRVTTKKPSTKLREVSDLISCQRRLCCVGSIAAGIGLTCGDADDAVD